MANKQAVIDLVYDIANKLRGPYRPPQYRRVMLPMTVLRRLDLLLQPTKDDVIAEFERLEAQGLEGDVLHKVLARKASRGRRQPLYNISPFTFEKMLGDPPNIAANLSSFINGFSENVRRIFERFEFEVEIEKLDKSNRLFLIVKEFADPKVKLHPNDLDNADMGDVFEELVRRFNEQANEEAGDHFTPREVIRLMANLVYTDEEDVWKPGIVRTIYDPTCGTGGMLSVSEDVIKSQNDKAHLELFGQEYNAESWAICCADMLIKDESVDNIAFGDTLTDNGHHGRRFHYMLANPPFTAAQGFGDLGARRHQHMAGPVEHLRRQHAVRLSTNEVKFERLPPAAFGHDTTFFSWAMMSFSSALISASMASSSRGGL